MAIYNDSWHTVGDTNEPSKGTAFDDAETVVKFRKADDGEVEINLQGVKKVTDATDFQTIFTLPEDYRPETDNMALVNLMQKSAQGLDVISQIMAIIKASTGEVQVRNLDKDEKVEGQVVKYTPSGTTPPSPHVPVGGIIAWHKNLTGCPALPTNFVECNGQTLDDEDSPFDEQTIPDLNGDARFLRGGSLSGTEQDDAFQGHKHTVDPPTHRHIMPMNNMSSGYSHADNGGAATRYNATGSNNGYTSYTNMGEFNSGVPVGDGTHGTPKCDSSETRPINMSVVWIMRIK